MNSYKWRINQIKIQKEQQKFALILEVPRRRQKSDVNREMMHDQIAECLMNYPFHQDLLTFYRFITVAKMKRQSLSNCVRCLATNL